MPENNSQSTSFSVLPSFHGYQTIKLLSSDENCTKLLARRNRDGKDVLIKKYKIQRVGSWSEYKQTLLEFETLCTLGIDGVSNYYELSYRPDEAEPYYYVVEEYVDAKSIEELIESGYLFSEYEIYEIAVKILHILKKLASNDPPFCHGDLNPENVLIYKTNDYEDYKIILTNFTVTVKSRCDLNVIVGRYGYMPPEQMMGELQPASDIYALAALIVYMLSGQQPYDMPVKDFQLIFEPSLPSVSRSVKQVLHQMLEPRIDNRLCDYDELIEFFSSGALNKDDSDIPNDNGFNAQNNEYMNQGEYMNQSEVKPNINPLMDQQSFYVTDEKKDTSTGKIIAIVVIGMIVFFIRLILRLN